MWYQHPDAQRLIRSLVASPPALIGRSADYGTSVDHWTACEWDERVERLHIICDDAFHDAENSAPGGPNSPAAEEARVAFLAGPLVDDILEAIVPGHCRRSLWATRSGDPAVVAALREELFGRVAA